MFSTEEKFDYFLKIEKQIHVVIKANYDKPKDLILNKIQQLISIQNSKSALTLELDTKDYDEGGSLTLYLKEYVKLRGSKKVFQTILPITSIIREIRLDIILSKKYEKYRNRKKDNIKGSSGDRL